MAAILTRFHSLRTLQICELIVAAVGIALSGFATSQIHVIILFGSLKADIMVIMTTDSDKSNSVLLLQST